MKKCTGCGVEKPLTEFHTRSNRPSGHQSRCKQCENSVRWEGFKRPYILRNVGFVREYKNSHPCTDCGQSYPYYVMQFDHVRGEKLAEVSTMAVKGKSLTRILAEMEKCELVCANCHAERTFIRRNRVAGDDQSWVTKNGA